MASSGPSKTAQYVAAHRLDCTRLVVGYGSPEGDDLLARDVAGEVTIRRERMHRYVLARTAFFDRCVVEAIRDGVDQIVILGAGYDGRSLRYARDDVRFFEVDLEVTQLDKLGRLARLGIDASTVTYVPADFAIGDAGELLAAAGLAPRSSLFVLEGVVPYLDDQTLRSLLASVARVAAPGSTLAVSVGVTRDEADPEAEAHAVAFRSTVAALGEPARSTLSASESRALLAACGWIEVEPVRDDALDAEAKRRLGLVVARRA